MTVIDTATNQVIGSPIAVGSGPFDLAITPNGGNVYVSNTFGNSVSVITRGTYTPPIPAIPGTAGGPGGNGGDAGLFGRGGTGGNGGNFSYNGTNGQNGWRTFMGHWHNH